MTVSDEPDFTASEIVLNAIRKKANQFDHYEYYSFSKINKPILYIHKGDFQKRKLLNKNKKIT